MVKKTSIRLAMRKARSNLPQLIGLMLLIIVGVCFFLTLFTIVIRYEETAELYFVDNSYADITFYGIFNDESVLTLSKQQGILTAHGRTVRDFREGENIFRVISLTGGINTPHLYEGRFPENEKECMILNRNALTMNLAIGDTMTFCGNDLIIVGLAASPEYIYLIQNERIMMAQPDRFAVVFVTGEYFQEGYNEVVALTDSGTDINVDKFPPEIRVLRTILQKDQLNHYLYRSDLGEISSFAYIFPFIFAVLIAVVIYIMLKRIIQKDRRQIGIMKALGVSDSKIIGIYLARFCLTALAGAIIGCLVTIIICDYIIGIFSYMFEVPALIFVIYPGLWSIAVLMAVILCAVSGFIALRSILPLMPANAMRPRQPRSGKKILIERIGFLRKYLNFNTRYAIKNALRNKGRFFAVVLGMCGSTALLVFSLGFYDSLGNTKDMYFDHYVNHDIVIDFNPLPLSVSHPAAGQLTESQKALVMPVTIFDDSYLISVVEAGFDMVNIPFDALNNGIIVSEYHANEWGVKVGDILSINDTDTIVSAIIPQYLGLTLYTNFEYLLSVSDEIPLLYNTLYGRTDNIEGLTTFLKENNIDYATLDNDKSTIDTMMESMSILIWFMTFCAVILGVTVLYSVGLINLSAREYEYMFLGVMGYQRKNIIIAHIKETVLQFILAIPLGFLLGNALLDSVKGEFSGNGFVIAANIYPLSYALAAIIVIGVSALMAVFTYHYIGRLDIVEGLKAQDD